MSIQETARRWFLVREELAKECAQPSLTKLIRAARIVIWNKTAYQLASNGASEFVGAEFTSEMVGLSDEPELWCLDDFALVRNADKACAVVWLPRPDRGVECSVLVPLISGGKLAFAGSAEFIPAGQPIEAGAALLIAMQEFTRQKIAALEPVNLSRSERRALTGKRQEIPDIRIVQLRERESSVWHGSGAKTFHHRWIVQGHWRKLSEPRKSDGAQVTFVHSYIKGPEGAPLLERSVAFSVSR